MTELSPQATWSFYGMMVIMILVFLKVFYGSPFRYVEHTLYLSGTLGAGKTSYAAAAAKHYTKKGYKVYSTFVLDGAIPFDLSIDPWPEGKDIVVILDEMLRLKLNKFYDVGVLADGLTMARQYEQVVLFLSQSHLSELGSLKGTIQVYVITKKIKLGSLGHINIMRFASNPFRDYGTLKAPGSKFVLAFIPSSIYKTYQSKLIYGFTAHKDGKKIPKEELPGLRIMREARYVLRKKKMAELVKLQMAQIIESGELETLASAAHVTEAIAEGAAHVMAATPKPKRKHRVKKASAA